MAISDLIMETIQRRVFRCEEYQTEDKIYTLTPGKFVDGPALVVHSRRSYSLFSLTFGYFSSFGGIYGFRSPQPQVGTRDFSGTGTPSRKTWFMRVPHSK